MIFRVGQKKMSSPTPDSFVLKAEQARRRAERSRFLMKAAAAAAAIVVVVFVVQGFLLAPKVKAPEPVPLLHPAAMKLPD